MSKIRLPSDGYHYEPPSKTVPQAMRHLTAIGQVPAVVEYQPGNGTRYVLSLVALPSSDVAAAMGAPGWTSFMMVLHNMGTRRAVFVGPATQYDDLTEKLDIGKADALALCCLIRYVCGDMDNLTW